MTFRMRYRQKKTEISTNDIVFNPHTGYIIFQSYSENRKGNMGQALREKVVVWARRPWFYLLPAVVLALPVLFLTSIPPADVASRYAPMAEAFAAGEWFYAFHPRVPMLHPVLGGVFVFLTGCDGFFGVKLASMLLFALAVVPLFELFKRIMPWKYACWGVLFYLFCHLLLQYAGEGLRDNGKTFSLALAAWALLSLWDSPRRLRYYLWLGAAIGLGFLFRTELLVVGGFLLLTAAVRECWKKQFPWRSFAGGVVMLLLLTPAIAVNRYFTGYPVPDVRIAVWMQQREVRRSSVPAPVSVSVSVPASVPVPVPAAASEESSDEPVRPPANSPEPAVTAESSVSFSEALPPPENRRELGVLEYIGDFFNGFYPPFLLPVLFGIAWRIARRSWNGKETLLFCIVVGNAVVTALLILIGERYLYISRRYLLPAAPLLFGWSGYFAVSLWDYCRERWPKWFPVGTGVLIFVVCGGILYGAALSPMIRNYTSKKRRARNGAVFACAEIIRGDYRGASSGERSFLLTTYRSNRRPFVVVPESLDVSPMLAGGSQVFDRRVADYLVLKPGETPPARQWRKVAEVRGYRDERFQVWAKLEASGGEEGK